MKILLEVEDDKFSERQVSLMAWSLKSRKKHSRRMKKRWKQNREEMLGNLRHWSIKTEDGKESPTPKRESAKNEKVVHCPYCRGKFGIYPND